MIGNSGTKNIFNLTINIVGLKSKVPGKNLYEIVWGSLKREKMAHVEKDNFPA